MYKLHASNIIVNVSRSLPLRDESCSSMPGRSCTDQSTITCVRKAENEIIEKDVE